MLQHMHTEDALLISAESGAVYAVPWDVIERSRTSPEQRAELAKLIAQGDISGFSAGALLPHFRNGDYHAVPAGEIERYRLSEAAAAQARHPAEEEVHGQNVCPPGSILVREWFGGWNCVPIPKEW